MYKIIKKIILNSHVSTLLIEAPLIAAKAKPGQFIILRVDNNSERIPLTIAGVDTEKGLVKIIFQVVGSSTYKLNQLKENDFIQDFAGPLGKPTELEHLKNVLVIGGGVGCAIALPIAEYLHKNNCNVTSIIGFKNKDLIILEEDFKKCSNELVLTTDDGSYGFKGNCVDAMKPLLEKEKYDEIICIGPLIMMKNVCAITNKLNLSIFICFFFICFTSFLIKSFVIIQLLFQLQFFFFVLLQIIFLILYLHQLLFYNVLLLFFDIQLHCLLSFEVPLYTLYDIYS